MKITGAEWKDFEANGWPEGYVWSDESTLDDGRDVEGIAANEVFVIPDYWSVYWESIRDPVPPGMTDDYTIRSLVRKWRKQRDTVTLVVSVPRGDEAKARDVIKSNGWKIA